MKRSSLLIAMLVAFGIYGCGEPSAPQKKAATETQRAPGPAKPSEAAQASPTAAPAGDMKKEEMKKEEKK